MLLLDDNTTTAPERVLLLEVEVEARCQDKRRSAAAELAHEPSLVRLLVGRQLARPVELPPAPRVGTAVLPAVEPAVPEGAKVLGSTGPLENISVGASGVPRATDRYAWEHCAPDGKGQLSLSF